MRGGRHNGTIVVAIVGVATTLVAVLIVPAAHRLAGRGSTEVAATVLTGTAVTIEATRDVPVRQPIAHFVDPERGALRDARGFVETAFRDLLDRTPGETTLAQWTERLDGGGPRTALTTMLTSSAEYRRRTVERLHRRYLGREATDAEVAAGAAALGQGHSTPWLRAQLLGSPDYFSHRAGGSVGTFVAGVYEDILGRPPDATSTAHWTGRLTSGGLDRTAVAASLLASGESRRRYASSVYEQFLGRVADAGEASHWATLMERGLPEEDVTAAVVASAEYFGKLPADYTATVDWGDGSIGAATVRRVGVDGIDVTAAHPFRVPGTFAVTVTLTKADGATATTTSTVVVERPNEERFVAGLFSDLLERPASGSDISAWTRSLMSGGDQARERAAGRMLTTGERRRVVVAALFEQYLDRRPTPEAAAGWVDGLATRPAGWLRAQLLGSSEYYRAQAGATTAGFVDAVFGEVFGRPPDDANRSRLSSMLTGGASRAAVAQSLLETSEARRRLVTAHYTVFLDRPPRSDESRHWVASLGRGTSENQLIASLLGSSEYFSRASRRHS